MCGIAGVYHHGHPEPVNPAVLERMNACMLHRGPDEGGVYAHGSIGLAMRRLAIIDLASGQQPMSDEEQSVWIVFNGEIYNFQSLRAELIQKGHKFKTTSDTEVIIQLYKELGVDCVERLRGMFAFSLWDDRNKRLLLARDRMGKKPLLYSMNDQRLCWASEMDALLKAPDISREIDPQALDLYLGLQYIPSPSTMFKAVKKLQPGHILIHEKGRVEIKRYWDVPLTNRQAPKDIEEAKFTLLDKLREATRLRMISEVPLGAFLSGGIDSTCVVALMSQLSERPVKTFVIGFEEETFSELKYARIAAERYGTDHTEFIVKAEMADVLPTLARHYGEPFGDSSALPTYYVARETRKHVTVALNGDGGDESFAGYARYRAMTVMRSLDWIPRPLRQAMGSMAGVLPNPQHANSLARKARRFLTDVIPSGELERYLMVVGIFFENQKRDLYSDAFRTRLGRGGATVSYLNGLFEQAQGLDPVNQLLYVDLHSYLPECLMAKMDIATMANSVEGRSPLLDHEVIEYAFQMPGQWKLKDGFQAKWILKETFKDMLPPEIFNRKKMGFGIPLGEWFRGKLKNFWKDHVLSDAALARGYFNRAYLERLFSEHMSGRFDHGYRMWNLLMLELWHEYYAPNERMPS